MFLEISQNSQENICARVYFLIKLQALGLQEKKKYMDLWTAWPMNCGKLLSDVLLSLANATDHKPCESEDKSQSEAFVKCPWNRSVIWLCERQPLNISTHPAKFGSYRPCAWGNMTFSNSYVTTELKCHVIFWGSIILNRHPAKFGVHREITFFICHVTTILKCHVTLWVDSPHPKSLPC